AKRADPHVQLSPGAGHRPPDRNDAPQAAPGPRGGAGRVDRGASGCRPGRAHGSGHPVKALTVEPTVGGLLAAGAALLDEAGLPSPRRDAEWLLADALGTDRLRLVLGLDRVVPAELAGRFRERIARR